MRFEFITVRMIKEANTLFSEHFASMIEDVYRRATFFFVEPVLVRNPRAAGIAEAERFGIGCDALRIVAPALIREVAADGGEPVPVQHLLEFFRSEVVGTG